VSQVEDGRRVGVGLVFDPQSVLVCPGVAYLYGQSAGIAFFAVFADVGERQARPVFAVEGNSGPDARVEAAQAAVQRILAVIDGKGVGLSIEREAAFGDAAAVASDERADVSRLVHIT